MKRRLVHLGATCTVAGLLTAFGIGPIGSVGATGAGTVPGINVLLGAACPSGSTCVAVGNGGSNDTTGKSVVINAVSGAVNPWSGGVNNEAFTAVACVDNTTTCLAIAQDAIATVSTSGGTLRVTATPKPPTGGIVALGSIACASTSDCYAVGFQGPRLSSQAIAVQLSGTGSIKKTIIDKGSGIGAIACPTSTHCFLSDYQRPNIVIQEVTGTTISAGHNMPAKTYVQAISCFGTAICYALGGNSSATPAVTNELFPLNTTTGAPGAAITVHGFNATGIACNSATRCVLVGFTGSGSTAKFGDVVINTGKAGTPTNLPGTSLSGVACSSSTVCFGVGMLKGTAIVDKFAV